MRATATTPAPLVPMLTDVVNKRHKHLATDLQPGDQLHFTAPILGFARGTVHALYGYCVHFDTHGSAYAVTGYINGGPHAVPYTEREARRYPTANQHEQWFGSVLMYMTEIDLTDYADCLRLERLSERVLPLLPADVALPFYRQAA
jgi:hypothetical protein